jgi:cytochrome b6-f complex iron-sulfur subunit
MSHEKGEARQPESIRRRDLLLRLGAGAGVVAIAAQAAAALRSLVPGLTYDPPTTAKVGAPTEFADGLTFLPDERLFIVRAGSTFRAVSAVCTHLGCTVRAEALSASREPPAGGGTPRPEYRFVCPCHGSMYDGDGINVSGPAPGPLAWYRLALAPDSGQLVVDLSDMVDQRFRLSIP